MMALSSIDIGSGKITCIISDTKDGTKILGYGCRKSEGIKYGVISDMSKAIESIQSSVYDAEKMANFNIQNVVVRISGSNVKSKLDQEVINFKKPKILDIFDVKKIKERIKNRYLSKNKEIIYLVAQKYIIDESALVSNPHNMIAKSLSIKFHVVYASFVLLKNLRYCLSKCRLNVIDYIVKSYASYFAIKNNKSGTCLVIDIGNNNSCFSIIENDKLIYYNNIENGGYHITHDIARNLNLNIKLAEKIKIINNNLIIHSVEEKELIKLTLSRIENSRRIKNINKLTIKNIIFSRISKILSQIKHVLEKDNQSLFNIDNIFLTGGGSNLIGIENLASEIFNKECNKAELIQTKFIPSTIDNVAFYSAIGMIIYGKFLIKKQKQNTSKKNYIQTIIRKLLILE